MQVFVLFKKVYMSITSPKLTLSYLDVVYVN